MKKFLFLAVAAIGLLATACTKDETAPVAQEEMSAVTFTVAGPEMGTRATYGDGYTATHLTWGVYDADGNYLEDLSAEGAVGVNFPAGSLSTTVKIDLVNGKEYKVIFWAGAEDAPYTVDFEEKKMTYDYDDQNPLLANQEAYDAFYKYEEIETVAGPRTETIELTRPFAQLNIATADTEKAAQGGLDVVNTQVVVKTYNTLDLVNGDVSGDTTHTYKFAAIPADNATGYNKTIEAGGNTYDLLSMNYILVNAKAIKDVKFTVQNGSFKKDYTYENVPLQRNYRTNIIGNLLTSTIDFDIEILPGFATEEHNVEVVYVASAVELVDEITNGDADQVILTGDINLNDLLSRAADKNLVIPAGRTVTLNLGGYTLSAVSTQTGKNYEMIDVRGTLTVANGTITTEHTGTNMGWNNSTNVFNVTAGGVLNLESVVAKNLGGSDMAFVAHLNNWGEATLNVNNSTLESTYIAVRVFNSGYDMNNVTIKNTTLKGKYCFWVHNYKAAGDSVGTDETLNVDIYNNNNTFVYTSKAPILYGFDSPIYFDENGNKLVYSVDDLASAIAVGGELTLQNDIEASDIIFIGNSVKINGNGHSISTTANRVMRITAPEINVELNNVNIVSNAVRVGSNDIRGISVDNTASYLNLTLNGCNIDFTDDSAHDWAYAVNQTATTYNTISINGGTYEGANVINIWGSNNTINIDGATLNCLYKPNTQYHGSCITFNSGASNNTVKVKNTTFNSPGGNAKVKWDEGSNNTVSHENNTDNTTVANFIDNAEELVAAVENKESAILNADIEISEPLTVEGKVFSLDLNGKTLTAPQSSALVATEGADLTVKNGKVIAYESTVRAIGGKATIESGEYTSTGTALDDPATYRYSIDSREGGEIIINGGTFKSNNGMINVGSTVTINGGKFENIVEKSMTRHFAYVSAPLTINDGEFYGKANSGAGGCFFCGAAAGGDIQIKGGKFTSLWTSGSVNRIFEVYFGGTINVTGGLFNTNGGIATFVEANDDAATKDAYPYKAK